MGYGMSNDPVLFDGQGCRFILTRVVPFQSSTISEIAHHWKTYPRIFANQLNPKKNQLKVISFAKIRADEWEKKVLSEFQSNIFKKAEVIHRRAIRGEFVLGEPSGLFLQQGGKKLVRTQLRVFLAEPS